MSSVPQLPLKPEGTIPQLGFGTWQIQGDACQNAVRTALEVGYRHIDTADAYGNHEDVGEALTTSGVPRDRIFLTTKVFRDNLRHDSLIGVCERSLKELQTDYLDLFLVHWPNNDVPMEETFSAMGELIANGKIRHCGVSNFTAKRLEKALKLDLAPISNNQVEYHPLLNQKRLFKICQKKGVTVTAYSPLAQGKVGENATVQAVAGRVGKSPAQVALRWLLQRGLIAIPKASSRAHIESNWEVLDFALPPGEYEAMDTINEWQRLIAWDVAEFDD